MKNSVLFLMSFLFLSISVQSQNHILDVDQTALVFQGNYYLGDGDTKGFGIRPSLNLNGKTSIGVDLQRFNSNIANSYKTTPYASYLFLKKSNDTGIVNLGLGAYYSSEKDDDDTTKVNSFGVGPQFSYGFKLENNFRITLIAEVSFGWTNSKYQTYYDSMEKDKFNNTGFGFSVNLLLKKIFFDISLGHVNLKRRDSDYDESGSDSALAFSLGYIID